MTTHRELQLSVQSARAGPHVAARSLLLFVANLPGVRVGGVVNEERLRECRTMSDSVVFVALRYGRGCRALQVRGLLRGEARVRAHGRQWQGCTAPTSFYALQGERTDGHLRLRHREPCRRFHRAVLLAWCAAPTTPTTCAAPRVRHS